MKSILIIAYHFPPEAAVGAMRPANFAKFLPKHGWQPIVLTVKHRYYGANDQSLPDGYSAEAIVIRTGMIRSPSYYYRKFKRRKQRNSNESQSITPYKSNSARSRLRQAVSSLVSFPDEQAGWLPFALTMALKVVRQRGVAGLMTFGPPHSVHIIGACLSKWCRIPWIADFRDPYIEGDSPRSPAGNAGLSLRLARKLENWFMSRATSVLTTTDRYTEHLQLKYPVYKQKMITLPNGYDPDDFVGIQREKDKQFTISYLGTFYQHRDPEPLLHALSELINEQEIDRVELAVRFIGHCNKADGKAVGPMITRYGLEGIVEIKPWVPRHYALEIMVRSHVLLLLAEDQALMIPGKVYDYLGAGSDILAITGDGATADLLRETGTGIVIAPGDLPSIKAQIKALYRKYLTAKEHDQMSPFAGSVPPTRYDRRQLTEELARLLEKYSQPCRVKQQ